MNDFKFAIRQLLKNPGFTAVALLTLALGIGANTAIFSVVNAVLLKPLPYAEPGQLVQLRKERSGGASIIIGSAEFVKIKAQSQAFARIAAYGSVDMNLTGAGQAQRLAGGQVPADFFPLLGIQPALGRNFTREEDTPNGPSAAILGHDLWQSQFGGDPNVLGRAITLNARSYTVVGILPASFQFPDRFQLWTPLALPETIARGGRLLKAIARLKPGVTLAQAHAELRTIAQRDQPAQPGRGEGGMSLIGLHEHVVGDVKGALLVLLGRVALGIVAREDNDSHPVAHHGVLAFTNDLKAGFLQGAHRRAMVDAGKLGHGPLYGDHFAGNFGSKTGWQFRARLQVLADGVPDVFNRFFTRASLAATARQVIAPHCETFFGLNQRHRIIYGLRVNSRAFLSTLSRISL